MPGRLTQAEFLQLFFKFSLSGKAEYDSQKATKFWYEPAQPGVRCTQAPKVDYCLTPSLLLWMPRHFWKVVFRCTEKKCDGQELTSAG